MLHPRGRHAKKGRLSLQPGGKLALADTLHRPPGIVPPVAAGDSSLHGLVGVLKQQLLSVANVLQSGNDMIKHLPQAVEVGLVNTPTKSGGITPQARLAH